MHGLREKNQLARPLSATVAGASGWELAAASSAVGKSWPGRTTRCPGVDLLKGPVRLLLGEIFTAAGGIERRPRGLRPGDGRGATGRRAGQPRPGSRRAAERPWTTERRSLTRPDGRVIEFLAAGPADGLPLVLHEGTPCGLVLYPPTVRAAAIRGLRVVLAARPGYEGSTPRPGRRVVDVAQDTAAVLDDLGAATFVTLGWSGGGPHALACAAALPGRCLAAGSIAGVAPFTADGLDWPGGMAPENVAEFGAARRGAAALTEFLGPGGGHDGRHHRRERGLLARRAGDRGRQGRAHRRVRRPRRGLPAHRAELGYRGLARRRSGVRQRLGLLPGLGLAVAVTRAG